MAIRRLLSVLAAVLALNVALTINASAQSDKILSLYIGSGTGGGYDSYGRLAAMSLGKFLPNTPTVIVKNMPGGSGTKVANFIANIAPKDGTAIGITSRNLIVAPMLQMIEKDSVSFDPNKFIWLGNLNTDVSFIIVRSDSGINSFDDLRKQEVIVGSTGFADNNGIFPFICNNLLGTRFKVVSGYKSSSDLLLALERGEINGIVGFSWASLNVQRPDWVAKKTVRLLAQLGTKPLPEQASVPLLRNLAPNEDSKKALTFIATFNELGRPFFAPPDTEAAAVADLRGAFKKMVSDNEFLANANKQKMNVSFIEGETVQEMVADLLSVDPKIAEIVRHALNSKPHEDKK